MVDNDRCKIKSELTGYLINVVLRGTRAEVEQRKENKHITCYESASVQHSNAGMIFQLLRSRYMAWGLAGIGITWNEIIPVILAPPNLTKTNYYFYTMIFIASNYRFGNDASY